MKKNMICGILVFLLAIPFYAQAEETTTENRYSRGSVFSFGFGAGMSGVRATGDNLQNTWGFPGMGGSIRYTIYCTNWFGLTTGAEYNIYQSDISLQGVREWQNAATVTSLGQEYTHRLNFVPVGEGASSWSEREYIEMLEVPLAITFKAKPKKVGFITTVGVKAGFPMRAKYSYQGVLNHSGYFADLDYLEQADNHFMANDSYDVTEGIDYNRESWSKIYASAFAEVGLLFQLHPRLDMSVDVYGSYGHHDLFGNSQERTVLGFGTEANQLADKQVMNRYEGLIGTDAIQRANLWNCGVKIALHVNSSIWSDADRAARKAERAAKKATRATKKSENAAPKAE